MTPAMAPDASGFTAAETWLKGTGFSLYVIAAKFSRDAIESEGRLHGCGDTPFALFPRPL